MSIGIFDSGVGGLTVAKAVNEIMPRVPIVYLGDNARFPYGSKSEKTIIEFSMQNAAFLLSKKVSMIVVACNTASAAAIPALRAKFEVPIVGVIEAGSRKAVAESKSKNIGVIGTYRTVTSGAYVKAIHAIDAKAHVIQKSCPLLVPIVEENFQDHPAARLVVKEYLDDIMGEIDTLILGCTHYPLIKHVIADLYPKITLIDSAAAVAEEVKHTAQFVETCGAAHSYFVTDISENFVTIAKRIIGDTIVLGEIPL